MTTHGIVEQIDAYLALLREAREILLNGGKGKSATKITSRKKAPFRKTKIQSRTSANKIKGVPQRSPAGQVVPETRAISTVLPQPSLPNIMHSDPTQTMSSMEKKAAWGTGQRVAAVRRPTFRQSSSTREKTVKQDSHKPATPLSHPVRSNVVVISAEQVRLERERLLKPVVMRPRSTASSATGRLAFEGLFSR